MGVVYKAHDTKLDRTVALKFLSPRVVDRDAEKTRFVHEAKSVAALHHPNICTIHEIDEFEGQLFISMAYIEGTSLRDQIADGRVGVAEAIDTVMQICSALQEAHDKAIVHRDVKPANIMLEQSGRAVLMDFGLARQKDATRLTRTGTTVGTVAYMSPEQLRGDELDGRSDLWSLGVVLYELLAGCLPFKGEVEPALIYSIMNEDTEPIVSHLAGAPAGLEGILARALAKDPVERYASAAELRADLEEVRSDPEAFPAGVPRRRSTRKRVFAGVAGLLAVVAAFFLVSRIFFDGQARASIAVLPCINVSGDPDHEYLSDGITEDLILHFSRLNGFRVLNPMTMFQYKGTEKSSREIAGELNATVLLRSRMRMNGDRIELSVQLIDPGTDEIAWADQYNEPVSNIQNAQRKLVLEVAQSLNVVPASAERQRLEQTSPVDREAYLAYQRGRALMRARTQHGMEKAIEYFQAAIAADSTWALPVAGLAEAHMVFANPYYRQGQLSYEELTSLAEKDSIRWKEMAKRALTLDPNLAEAHMVIGDYEKALEINPNLAWGYYYHSLALGEIGQHDRAIEAAETAVSLDPGNLVMNVILGKILTLARRYDRAERQLIESIDMDPEHSAAYVELLLLHVMKGEYKKAIEPMKKFVEIEGGQPEAFVPMLRAAAGEIDVDERVLSIVTAVKKLYGPHSAAWCYAMLSRYDNALDCLEEAFELGGSKVYLVHQYPMFDPIQSEPRLVKLRQRMAERIAEMQRGEKEVRR